MLGTRIRVSILLLAALAPVGAVRAQQVEHPAGATGTSGANGAAAATCPAPADTAGGLDAAFASIRDRVLPATDELRWLAIPWRETLADALLEADASDRPVLRWGMNGHPLGCT